ncbi:DUF397 domain-containing protein [Streptomyces scopuliridis]|uniref:DUF397 domain-containing protein n=1 Tax=Streptomyces scopuliridis TaxID=452529 RepID=UPI003688C1C0
MDSFDFRKSRYSSGDPHGECVEVALNVPGTVAVRDSKRQTGPILRVTPAAWDAFRAGLRKP